MVELTDRPDLLDGRFEDEEGHVFWTLNGQRHRIGGPAVDWYDSADWWMQYGELHRTDGPAAYGPYTANKWCLRGVHYTFEQWLEVNTELSAEDKVIMKLKYG
jgi:hypothetical protein